MSVDEVVVVASLPVCGGDVEAAVASGLVDGSVALGVVESDVLGDGAVVWVVTGWPVFWAVAVPVINPAASAAYAIERILYLQ